MLLFVNVLLKLVHEGMKSIVIGSFSKKGITFVDLDNVSKMFRSNEDRVELFFMIVLKWSIKSLIICLITYPV